MNTFTRAYRYTVAHKVLSVIVVMVVLGGGYLGYKHFKGVSTTPVYAFATVEKGTLTTEVTGTGQVSAENQVDLSPKSSGQVTYVGVKVGDNIKKGTVLARVDSSDAEKSVRDAEANLESAELALQKLEEPANSSSVLQSENSLDQSYSNGFSSVATAFLDLPPILSSLDDLINTGNGYLSNNGAVQEGSLAVEYRDAAVKSYYAADASVEEVEKEYQSVSVSSSHDDIETLIDDTYNMTKLVNEAVKDTKNLVDYAGSRSDSLAPTSQVDQDEADLTTYTNTVNSDSASLLAAQNSIENDKASLQDINAGSDSLDIKSAELSVTQKQNALEDAKETLSDYSVVAPFDGVVAVVNTHVGDTLSSGTAAATLITKQTIATLSLNEVDAAKVKAGQKATLTFDAISDLSLSGEVAEVAPLGTVSQGVVTYDVKIAFDSQDDRIKSGMSVSATILIDSKPNVLLVPSSAVKSDRNGNYVQMLDPSAQGAVPEDVPVQVGSSNDTKTEIVSGLNEGEKIISKTTVAGKTTTSTTSTRSGASLFSGGTTRVPR